MDNITKQKKLETNVRAFAGAFLSVTILTVMYVARAFIVGDLDYFFASYLTEFLLKSSGYFDGFKDTIPLAIGLIIIAIYNGFFAVATLGASKKFGLVYAAFALYIFDFVLLCICVFGEYFAPFKPDYLVDFIVHVFLILFATIGAISKKKLDKMKADGLYVEEVEAK